MACLDSWDAVLQRGLEACSPEELWETALSGPAEPADASAQSPRSLETLDFCARLDWSHVAGAAGWSMRHVLQDLRSPTTRVAAELPWQLLQLLPPPAPALQALARWTANTPLSQVVGTEGVAGALQVEARATAHLYDALHQPLRAADAGREADGAPPRRLDDVRLLQRYLDEPLVRLWHWLAWSRLASQAPAGGSAAAAEDVAATVRRARFVVLAYDHGTRAPRGGGDRHFARIWDLGALLPPEHQRDYLPWLPAVRRQLVAAEAAAGGAPHGGAQLLGGLAVLLQPSLTPAQQRLAYYWMAQGAASHVDPEVLQQAAAFCALVGARRPSPARRRRALAAALAVGEPAADDDAVAFPALLRRDP
jgi:hypothetical protein